MEKSGQVLGIVLDVDWAPDFVIEDTASLLIRHGVKATWFATHPSPAIEQLKSHPELFELGIHPNFLANSTQGNFQNEIIDYCMSVVPEAVSMRTHAYYQSSPMFAEISRRTSITNDASVFMPLTTSLRPGKYYIGGRYINRLPVYWEDDNEMKIPERKWSFSNEQLNEPGMKIFAFHPIHIFLNIASFNEYENLKAKHPDTSYLSFDELNGCRNLNSEGTRSCFESFLTNPAAQGNFYQIREIPDLYK